MCLEGGREEGGGAVVMVVGERAACSLRGRGQLVPFLFCDKKLGAGGQTSKVATTTTTTTSTTTRCLVQELPTALLLVRIGRTLEGGPWLTSLGDASANIFCSRWPLFVRGSSNSGVGSFATTTGHATSWVGFLTRISHKFCGTSAGPSSTSVAATQWVSR